MAGARFWTVSLLVLMGPLGVARSEGRGSVGAGSETRCVIYSLQDFDADFAEWVAVTIPDVIEPGTWACNAEKREGTAFKVRYCAPRKVLVVYHEPGVQAKVEHFLEDLRSAASMAKKKTPSAKQSVRAAAARSGAHGSAVVQAEYRESAEPPVLRPAAAPPVPGYPVAPPARAPRHLFHFIIRYEGDGVIDENVSKVLNQMEKKEKEKDEDDESSAAKKGTLEEVLLRQGGAGAALGAVAGAVSGVAPSAPVVLPEPQRLDLNSAPAPSLEAKPAADKKDSPKADSPPRKKKKAKRTSTR